MDGWYAKLHYPPFFVVNIKEDKMEMRRSIDSFREDNSMSIGAYRVRESFNPSQDNMVDKIKRYTADLIDLCEEIKHLEPRLAALAQTAYEEAAMWAVKAATTREHGKGLPPILGTVNIKDLGDKMVK
jgi:hypothetical protein